VCVDRERGREGGREREKEKEEGKEKQRKNEGERERGEEHLSTFLDQGHTMLSAFLIILHKFEVISK
jgi:hypothetical protein